MLNLPTISLDVVTIVGCVVTASAVIDYRQHKIPNYITIPAALVGLAYSFMPGWIGPVSALLGLLVGFSLLILPWILGGGGMGDVKLLAALGAWLGPFYILIAFAGATVVASFMAMGVLAYYVLSQGMSSTKQRYLATAGGNVSTSNGHETTTRKQKRVLPFAVPIAISTWLLLAWLMVK
jgi:prepilin peptidase CpaA